MSRNTTFWWKNNNNIIKVFPPKWSELSKIEVENWHSQGSLLLASERPGQDILPSDKHYSLCPVWQTRVSQVTEWYDFKFWTRNFLFGQSHSEKLYPKDKAVCQITVNPAFTERLCQKSPYWQKISGWKLHFAPKNKGQNAFFFGQDANMPW